MADEHAVIAAASAAPEAPVPARRASPRRTVVQARLRVGAAGDRFEREADEVASAVMRRLAGSGEADDDVTWATGTASARIHRATASSGPAGGPVDTDTEADITRATGGGRPLGAGVRRSMERGFGADFGAVRVHADDAADHLNRAVGARAFTTGADIFFGADQYRPSSRAGQELLAHELTHVVQQGGAAIRRVPEPAEASSISERATGPSQSRITLSTAKGEIGSVTVSDAGDGAVEATSLSVAPGERGRGYGSELLDAAARSAERLGRSTVQLGSEDHGSGRLDGWYASLGFAPTHTDDVDNTHFAAPTSRLRRSVQRMDRPVVWWELVGEKIEARYEDKKGGYNLVKGKTAPDGKKVFETNAQRQSKTVKAKTYAEEVGPLPAKLPTSRFMLDPGVVRYCQDSIGRTFSDGKLLQDTATALKTKKITPGSLEPIRIFMNSDDRLVTLDNRRLWCCNSAGTQVHCRWATDEEVDDDWKAGKFTAGKKWSEKKKDWQYHKKGALTIEVRR